MTILNKNSSERVAIVFDWCFLRRGGERVIEKFLVNYPEADLFCLFGNPKQVLQVPIGGRVTKSWLAQIPLHEKFYKILLPLFPSAIESFDFSGYSLIVSSSHCVAKGIITPPYAIHICYIHSPMRYVWDQEHRYFPHSPSWKRPWEIVRRLILSRLRLWDVTSSERVDCLIANSQFVARRCELYYGKKAHILYPPVQIEPFLPLLEKRKVKPAPPWVLMLGAFVPYKNMEIALQALATAGIPVIAAGTGRRVMKNLRLTYKGNQKVRIVESPSDEMVKTLMEEARVFLHPGIEDFGITPIEAMAAGLWAVGPSLGGTAETICEGISGFHFPAGDWVKMVEVVKKALECPPTALELSRMAEHVEQFSTSRFLPAFQNIITSHTSESL